MKMGKTIRYTEPELETLRSQYGAIGAIGVARLLGRTADSVKFMAHRMGVKVSKQYRTATAIRANKSWARTAEMRTNIGNGHRKYKPFLCKTCGKHISHHTEKCWSCYSDGRRKNVSVSALARRMLYPVWIFPILTRDEFMCQRCGSSRDLVVHHLRKFSAIAKIVSGGTDTPESRYLLAGRIVSEHTLDDGITLCRDCHKEAHGKKRGELQENLTANGEGNLQPSQSNVISIVDWKVQRVTVEDSQTDKTDTSAPLAAQQRR
jgi:hypothetical protein